MRKVLITGVAGFIGSNLLDEFLRRGYTVVGIDDFSHGFMRNIQPSLHNSNFIFKKGDVCNYELLKELSRGVDTIVHLAAYKIPRYGNALKTLKINTEGTENVLNAGKENKCRVIIASTSDVYGKNSRVPFSEDGDIVLGKTTVKRWSYAVSKIFDEHLCFAYFEEHKVPITILRYFGSYGPNQNLTWWGGPQSVFIQASLRNEVMEIHGDGLQTRTFCYITDTVNGTVRAIENEKSIGEVFNIGNINEISIVELARKIWYLVGTSNEPKIKFVPYSSFSGHYEDVRRRLPDLTKAKRILGYEPQVPLEEGLKKTIQWQRNLLNQ